MTPIGMRLRALYLAAICVIGYAACAQSVAPVTVFDSTAAWTEIARATLQPVTATEKYTFTGQPVLRNGRIAVGLTQDGILLYAVDAAGTEQLRARLVPVTALGKSAPALRDATLVAASRNQAELMVTLAGDGGTQRLGIVLKRDEVTAEIKPLAGAQALQVHLRGKYLLVPNFVGDDFLFAPAEYTGRSFLPSENILVNFIEHSAAIVQVVWPMGEQQVEVTVSGTGEQARVDTAEITFENSSIFVAAWETPGLWYEGRVPGLFTPAGQPPVAELAIPWQPPYAAQWRSLFHGVRCDTTWEVRAQRTNGTMGQHGGRSSTYTWPSWIEKGKTWVHLPPDGAQTTPADFFLLYALRRTAKTPPTQRTPEDVLREALGAGPCEYLLDLEGAGTMAAPQGPICVINARFRVLYTLYEQNPTTPDYLLAQVDAILEQGLQQFQRVRQYRQLGLDLRKVCADTRAQQPQLAGDLEEIDKNAASIILFCDRMLQNPMRMMREQNDYRPKATDPEGAMREIAAELKRVLRLRNPDSKAEVYDLESKLDGIARSPQGMLPDPRRLARMIQYQAAQLAPKSPEAAAAAKTLRNLTGKTLRGKHWAEMGE